MPLDAQQEEPPAGEGATPVDPAKPAGWRVRASLVHHAPALAAAAAGLAWLLVHVGGAILDPTRIGWVMRGDWAAGYLGWAFFRLAPLGLPLGANPGYPWPIGSSLAYSDSIPLVGILLRPLAWLLPADFQYIGPWLGLCFALQGFVGAKLVWLATGDRLAQALGGSLFALAPPLLHRVVGPNTGHASLTAQWLVLAFLWVALAPVEPGRVRRRVVAAAALVLVASGVHPYHVVMGVVLSTALVVRLVAVDRLAGWRTVLLSSLGLVGTAALGLLAFGYLDRGVSTPAPGFGIFSSDALSLLNPMGWSRSWNGLRVGQGQYEGFGYLGAGAILLAAAGGVSAALRRTHLSWRSAIPVLVGASLLALLSLSGTITIAGRVVATISAYGWFPWLASTFRSSGRFVWSLHYLAVLGGIAALAASWRDRPRAVAAAFGTALAIQAADVRPPLPMRSTDAPQLPIDEGWGTARGAFGHVALVPPYIVTGGGEASQACPPVHAPDAQLPAAYVAYQLSATFNSAYLARVDPFRAGAACEALWTSVLSGRLDPETIYIVHPEYRRFFRAPWATCGRLDGMDVCVKGGRHDQFSEVLIGPRSEAGRRPR